MIILPNVLKWRIHLLTVPYVLMQKTHVYLYLLRTSIHLYQTEENAGESPYEPIPKYILQLKTMAVSKVQKYFERWWIQVRNQWSYITKWPFVNFIIYGFKWVTSKALKCRHYIYIYFGQSSPSFCTICGALAMSTYPHFLELSLPFENYRENVSFIINLSPLFVRERIEHILQGHLQDLLDIYTCIN